MESCGTQLSLLNSPIAAPSTCEAEARASISATHGTPTTSRHDALSEYVKATGDEARGRARGAVLRLLAESDDLRFVDRVTTPKALEAALCLPTIPVTLGTVIELQRTTRPTPSDVTSVVTALLEPSDYPWLVAKRSPSSAEREAFINRTAQLLMTQRYQFRVEALRFGRPLRFRSHLAAPAMEGQSPHSAGDFVARETTVEFDLDLVACALGTTPQGAISALLDGRTCSPWSELWAASLLNLAQTQVNSHDYDLIDPVTGGSRGEVKCLTLRNGVDLAKSKNKGTGRAAATTQDVQDALAQLDIVHIADVSAFPVVRLLTLAADDVAAVGGRCSWKSPPAFNDWLEAHFEVERTTLTPAQLAQLGVQAGVGQRVA